MKCIILTDSSHLLHQLVAILEPLGYTHQAESRGSAVIQEIIRTGCDLLIVDWNTALLHGEDLVSTLRRTSECQDVPIVVLYDPQRPQGVQFASRDAMGTLVLRKPFTAEALRSAIAEAT
jgi:DNA-binding response OmpR family regulator